MSRRSPWVLLGGVATAILLSDQITKIWAVDALATRSVEVFWTLRFHLVFNTGSAFSIGGGGAWGPVVSVLAILVVGFLCWYASRGVSRPAAIALGLIVGGTLGNLLDRAFRGEEGFLQGPVVDFIDLQWWPVFNIADAAIVVGVIIFAIVGLRGGDDADEPQPARSSDA